MRRARAVSSGEIVKRGAARFSRVTVVVIVGLVAASRATGDTPAAADFGSLVDRAVHDYTYGQFRRVIESLSRVVPPKGDVDPSTVAVAYKFLAASHLAVGDEAAAKLALREAIERDPTIDFDARRFPPTIVALFHNVKSGLSGAVRIECGWPDAQPDTHVDVIGERRGRCGDTLAVRVGRQAVRVARGDDVLEKTVVVFPGRTVEVVFEKPRRRIEPRLVEKPRPVRGDSNRRAWGWTLVGVAGGALVAGVALQLLAAKAKNDLDDARAQATATVSDGNSAASTVSTREKFSGVMFGLAGAIVAGGIVLLVSARAPNEPAAGSFRGVDVGVIEGAGREPAVVLRGRWSF